MTGIRIGYFSNTLITINCNVWLNDYLISNETVQSRRNLLITISERNLIVHIYCEQCEIYAAYYSLGTVKLAYVICLWLYTALHGSWPLFSVS
jgi:hypothetical protein